MCNHHMAVKCSFSVRLGRLLNVTPDFCNHWCTKGDVGHEMSVHDIDMEPICSLSDRVATFSSEVCKIGG